MSFALTGGSVITSLDPVEIVTADVVVDGDRVSVVGSAPGGGARHERDGCLILPGNVCAHTHLYSALARGMPYTLEPPTDFLQILQRIWWRLDRALDAASIRASALVGGAAALLAGTTTVIDHHASPNAIEGSLDVVADALAELGIRSVLSYEVTDRDGPSRAAAGVSENERFLATRRTLARGQVGAHASFTLSDATLAACAELAARAGTGVHIHVAEDDVDQADARARFGGGVVGRLMDAGALTDASLLAHCIHLDDEEIRMVRDAGAWVAHNPTSNMNNAVGHAAVARLGDRVALGTDGIGGDMFAESRTAYFRARDDELATAIGWPLGRLAEGARLAGRLFGEPGLGTITSGAPADLVVLDYAAPTPLEPANLAGHWMFGFGASDVRDVVVAGELVVEDRRLTRVDQDELAAAAAVQAAALWERLEGLPAHPFSPEWGSRMTVATEGRVALYLQDLHPIRDGMAYARYAEERGFEAVWQAESRLVREATVPMAAFAAVTDRIKIGSGVINNWTRNIGLLAATFSTLDDLAPGRVDPGDRRVVGPAGDEGRDPPSPSAASDAGDRRGEPPAARDGAGHVPRRVRERRRHRDRHRARRPLAEGRADLHRRDRPEDDGARRRDRGRRGPELHGQPRLQRRGHGAARDRRRQRPAARSRTSTVPS